jgi:outer membrane protein W
MRRLVLLTLLISAAAFAQEKSNMISVFVSDPEYMWTSNNGGDFNAGYGIALQHMFSPRWSGELSVSHRNSHARAYFYDFNGNVINTVDFHARTNPVDILAQYHFLNETSWKPYIGAGVTHVYVSTDSSVLQRDETYGTIDGGVVWRIRPELGLRFDVKALFGDRPSYIHSTSGSFGLAWRF